MHFPPDHAVRLKVRSICEAVQTWGAALCPWTGCRTPRLTTTGPAAADETQTVSDHGYEVTVPASWPVIDLAADPTACVRLDRPAVYLGRSTRRPTARPIWSAGAPGSSSSR